MAGTVTYTKSFLDELDRAYVGTKVVVSWTSDSSGNADKVLPNLMGWIVKIKTTPSGSAAPTDNYDIKLKDSAGFDVLADVAANRDTSNTEVIPTPNNGVSVVTYVNGDYTFDITNAGNAKSGTCELWLKTR